MLSFATLWMNLEDIILSEINQAQKNKYFLISLLYLWNIKILKSRIDVAKTGGGVGSYGGQRVHSFN
jgi:hypothetical protein